MKSQDVDSGMVSESPGAAPGGCDIPSRQLEKTVLDRLRASRYLNRLAKRWAAASMIFAVPVPITLAFLAMFCDGAKAPVAACGIMISVLGVFLERNQKKITRQAAYIQELMDCELFELPWNHAKGSQPSPEEVDSAARKQIASGKQDKIENWYPQAVGGVPIKFARLICQRANCAWQKDVREKITVFSAVGIFVLAGIWIIFGLIRDVFSDFVLLGVTLLPAALLLIRLYLEHKDASELNVRLRDHAKLLIREAIANQWDDEKMVHESMALQNEILERRLNAPPVFEWIYDQFRDDNEQDMIAAAAHLVDEIRAKIQKDG